jgi:tetratricopeptide (TPR) repeat protein
MGLILALCALVGGWHYARLWIHYGSPLAGNWDPQLGFSWWQYDGYRTCGFYLRFGDALFHPWSSGPQSFGDGIYATLWGDGLLSSAVEFFSRPPWNYDLMALGYWLALLPTLAVLAGGILAVFKFIRQPSAEWFLLLGFGCLVLWAMVYMSLVVPYCMAKAFYGLPALVPFCVFGALGLDFLTRRSTKLGSLVCVVFGLWAINSYAGFWISRSSVPTAVAQARALARKGQNVEATEFLTGFLKQGLRREPRNADLRFSLAYFLTITGRADEGIREAEMLLQEDPNDCRGHHVLALAFAQQQQAGRAIEELHQVMALAPGYDPSWESFTSILIASGHPDETVSVCRQALAMAPSSPGLRLVLGSTLLLLDQEAEASAQLRYAYRLNPRSVDQLASLAWKLATDTNPAERNGAAAVKLAEQACALTGYSKTIYLDVLAAVYAEAGRYAEAIRTAERAEASALASGDTDGAAHTRQLLERLRTGQPWRNR